MALSSNYFEVVGDISCSTSFRGLIKPDYKLLCPKFLINFEAIRRLRAAAPLKLWTKKKSLLKCILAPIELEYNANDYTRDRQRILLSNKLGELLRIPVETRIPLVDSILLEAEKMEQEYRSFACRKVLHMNVSVELDVIDSDTNSSTR